METKRCKKCGGDKSIDSFAVEKKTKDGRRAECKVCRSATWRKWADKNPDKVRECQRRTVMKAKKRGDHWTQRNKKKVAIYQKRWEQRNKEKLSAYNVMRLAIKKGEIKKDCCIVCGAKEVHGHHDDYSKPLDVVWVCRKHHGELHRKGR